MFVDLNKYVLVLSELNITANQFLLCYLLYTDQKVNDKYVKKGQAMANLYRYSSNIPWTKEEVRDLVNKGYLIDGKYDSPQSYPDYLEVTDEFIDKIFIPASRFDELFDAYPTLIDNFTNPNGPKIKLKVCDVDEMRELYHRKVKTKISHRKIMELVEWGKENNEINFSFEKFVRGEMWRTLKQVQEDHVEHSDNMTAV